jgi:hypothetical protein
LSDFTPFHDEIRKVTADLLVGKYVTSLPEGISQMLGNTSLGILHNEGAADKFGFYYVLTRAGSKAMPASFLLRPFLDAHLPDGLGMTFDEEMVGWYFEGASTPGPGRAGDVTIADRIPATGAPRGGVAASFQVRMTVRDLNEFIEGGEHEASMRGTISFDRFQGEGPVTFTIDEQRSLFNYLKVNPATGEAEMRYHLEFRTDNRKAYVFEGRKYMQRDKGGIAEVLSDYTTLYCHVYRVQDDGTTSEVGIAYLKFRTFEDLAAVGNLAGFLGSFKVTGTDDPLLQVQGQMRFLAFTGQFVEREYDPLAPASVSGAAGGD